MARAFRGAGFQWATQFAYDPLAIAYANTEYQTHFLNLVYTPSKAISFMIAGAAFRQLPRGATHGRYPESERFGPFRVSYLEDLSEMVGDTAFYYSNDTRTAPPSPAALRHVAGVGSSPVVSYGGSGAYFLDRVGDGLWRLEVYPDAVWVVDPFTRPSLEREAARVIWRTRPMAITLPDLGPGFGVEPMAATDAHRPTVRGGTFDIRPGVYALTRSGTPRPAWPPDSVAFVAPPSSEASTAVVHTPPAELTAGHSFAIRAEVVSARLADSVVLFARRVGGPGRMLRVVMTPVGAFGYRAQVPAETVREGLVEYVVTVYQGGQARTFPDGVPGHPYRWDFTGRTFWRVPVVPVGSPVLLFDGRRDLNHLLYPHPWEYVRFRTDIVPGSEPEALAIAAVVEDFSPSPQHFALRTYLPEGQRTRLAEATAGGTLRIRARATGDRESGRVEVSLVERSGAAWGTVVELTDRWREIEIPLSALRPVPLALLPRPYPQFLPYLFDPGERNGGPRLTELDGLQFAMAATMFERAVDGARGFAIERVVLASSPPP
jgi:hypothetical protein